MPIRISQQQPVIAVSAADALNRDLPLSKFVGNQVKLIFSPAIEGITDAGMGTLYITTKNIMFYNSNECINIDYPTITIHAISRGDNDQLVRKPCIYCQLDLTILDGGDGTDIVPEMRLVPHDESCLDELFLALNECAALNPDPADDQALDELEEPFSGVSSNGLSAQGMRNMQHLENLLQESLKRQESDESEDWLIKMNPFTTTEDRFECSVFFEGLSRFLYNDKILEFAPTRPANRRKKLKTEKTVLRLESSQAIHNKRPSVLLRWTINGKHQYYIFDHTRMISIDIKKTQNRPALNIDLSYLNFEIFKGPNYPRKTVLLELENCIEGVNKWLQSPAMDDHFVNCVESILVREACLEREACFTDVESDLIKYDENWKQFISKLGQSDSSLDEIAHAYNRISNQFIQNCKWKASAYDHEKQLEWDRELHEIINENQELSNNEQAWITHLEKLKLNHSIKGFHKYLLK